MKKIIPFITLALFVIPVALRANNISVANVSVNGQNVASHFSMINFDISWEHSWRTIRNETNYDGAWVFVKFRKKSNSVWQHATINATGSTIPPGSVIQTAKDGKGVWVYHALPTADFTGNVNYTGAKIRWNYAADGVADNDDVEVRIFALEMVYVPTGAYKLGSGGTEQDHFYTGQFNSPYSVEAEVQIPVNQTTGLYYYSTSSTDPNKRYDKIGGDQAGPIPAQFPKGYKAFWIMKYECSQQQYIDFLNNLDATRAGYRLNERTSKIFTGQHPNGAATFPERAMNDICLNDYKAFADWSGLRPFTELEYEKACRGAKQAALPNEYPWGNTIISKTTSDAIVFPGLATEYAYQGNANYAAGRPTRTGMYATAISSRTSSGGTYYGIMDMAGNVTELCITVGSPAGRSFTPVNGDGSLNLTADADVPAWPADLFGFSARGGSYSYVTSICCTSYRTKAGYFFYFNTNLHIEIFDSSPTVPVNTYGIRLARSAE